MLIIFVLLNAVSLVITGYIYTLKRQEHSNILMMFEIPYLLATIAL